MDQRIDYSLEEVNFAAAATSGTPSTSKKRVCPSSPIISNEGRLRSASFSPRKRRKRVTTTALTGAPAEVETLPPPAPVVKVSMKTDEDDSKRKSPHYKKYLDVKFIVGGGGETQIIFGHERLLAMKCEYFREIFYGNKDMVKVIEETRIQLRLKEVHLTEFEPKGFQFLIDYLYTGKIDTSDLSVVLKAAKCAQKIGYSELMRKVGNYLKMNLTKDSAVQIYCLALAQNDLQLVRESMTFLSSNISYVVDSNGFLKLSEEDLCTFLDCDEWTLGDEVKVFELVKRWATYQIDHSKQISSDELRRLMGRAVYGIRFTQFSIPAMLQLLQTQPHLLRNAEIGQIVTYLLQRDALEVGVHEKVRIPPNFVARPRGVSSESTFALEKVIHPAPEELTLEAESEIGARAKEPGEGSGETEAAIKQDAEMEIDQNLNIMDDSHDFHESHCENGEIQLGPNREKNDRTEDEFDAEVGDYEMECSTFANNNNIRVFSVCNGSTPPAVGGNDEDSDNSESSVSDSDSASRFPTLLQFKKDLSDNVGVSRKTFKMESFVVTEINATLLLTVSMATSSTWVYLPNLKKFEVRFVQEEILYSGSGLKERMKLLFSRLSNILFFDVKVNPHYNWKRGKVLENLLGTRVNILITFAQSTILLIDHDQGKVIMNMLKGSQTDEILKGCRKSRFRLKFLGISDCDLNLSSLNRIPKKDLEVLLIRAVNGVSGRLGLGKFLEQCPNLKSVCWRQLTYEKIEMEKQNISKLRNIEHLALANLVLHLGDSHATFDNVKNLLLGQCTWDGSFRLRMPQIFPSVKKLLIYRSNVNSEMLYRILKTMPSIEWVLVCRMQMRGFSGVVTKFFSGVFDETYAGKPCATFILKKKMREEEIDEQVSYNEASTDTQNAGTLFSKEWEGNALLRSSDGFRVVNEWVFEFNKNEEFFKDFGVLDLMETETCEVTNLFCLPYYHKEINEGQ